MEPDLILAGESVREVRSFTNPTVAQTVFTNYKELTCQKLSDDLLQQMQD